MAVLNRNDKITIMTKEMLSESISDFKGTIDEYMKEITERYCYIEVQLWNDDYYCIIKIKQLFYLGRSVKWNKSSKLK